MSNLRNKYGGKIAAEKNRIDRERKFADSLSEEEITQKLIDDHTERVNNNKLVKVKVDHKTVIYVLRDKCMENPDGTWSKKSKKQNSNIL